MFGSSFSSFIASSILSLSSISKRSTLDFSIFFLLLSFFNLSLFFTLSNCLDFCVLLMLPSLYLTIISCLSFLSLILSRRASSLSNTLSLSTELPTVASISSEIASSVIVSSVLFELSSLTALFVLLSDGVAYVKYGKIVVIINTISITLIREFLFLYIPLLPLNLIV
ncbi:MAG: hypothetical protein BWY74_01368 [Firmicutes bacterium ADurb.Bin419]|nr:MAG: hypothetical protein BWY74_01368 [Firmicutes bacterium ADurb.Bin419]